MCCGHPPTSYTPSVPARVTAPAVGSQGLILVEFTGNDPRAQFGTVTGSYYPFQHSRQLYVDVRDWKTLVEVAEVKVD